MSNSNLSNSLPYNIVGAIIDRPRDFANKITLLHSNKMLFPPEIPIFDAQILGGRSMTAPTFPNEDCATNWDLPLCLVWGEASADISGLMRLCKTACAADGMIFMESIEKTRISGGHGAKLCKPT